MQHALAVTKTNANDNAAAEVETLIIIIKKSSPEAELIYLAHSKGQRLKGIRSGDSRHAGTSPGDTQREFVTDVRPHFETTFSTGQFLIEWAPRHFKWLNSRPAGFFAKVSSGSRAAARGAGSKFVLTRKRHRTLPRMLDCEFKGELGISRKRRARYGKCARQPAENECG
jgi:hypothetical protein